MLPHCPTSINRLFPSLIYRAEVREAGGLFGASILATLKHCKSRVKRQLSFCSSMAYRQLQGHKVAGAPLPSRQGLPRVALGRSPLRVSAVAEAEKTSAVVRGSSAVTPAPVDIANKLRYLFGRNGDYTPADAYHGTAWSVRERLIDSFDKTQDYLK